MRLANPAWVNKALTSSWAELEARGPHAPILSHGTASGAKRVRELGCGSWGCVLATHDPSVVLKITTDPTEARFVSLVMSGAVRPGAGLVRYDAIERLAADHDGKAIYAIWRESAHDVGKVFPSVRPPRTTPWAELADIERFRSCMTNFHWLAREVDRRAAQADRRDLRHMYPEGWTRYDLLRAAMAQEAKYADDVYINPETGGVGFDAPLDESPSNGGALTGALTIHLIACRKNAELMTLTESGRLVGHSLLSLLSNKILLADVHDENLGRVERGIVITDPGYMVPLTEKLARSPMPGTSRRLPNPKRETMPKRPPTFFHPTKPGPKKGRRAETRGVDIRTVRCACGGVCHSVRASALAESTGVENWECDTCHTRYLHRFRQDNPVLTPKLSRPSRAETAELMQLALDAEMMVQAAEKNSTERLWGKVKKAEAAFDAYLAHLREHHTITDDEAEAMQDRAKESAQHGAFDLREDGMLRTSAYGAQERLAVPLKGRSKRTGNPAPPATAKTMDSFTASIQPMADRWRITVTSGVFVANADFRLDMGDVAQARFNELNTNEDVEGLLRDFGEDRDYHLWQARS